MVTSRIEDVDLLIRDIESRMIEMQSLSHMMEILFEQVGPEYFKLNHFEPCEIFAIQKRLCEGLHTEFVCLASIVSEELGSSPIEEEQVTDRSSSLEC